MDSVEHRRAFRKADRLRPRVLGWDGEVHVGVINWDGGHNNGEAQRPFGSRSANASGFPVLQMAGNVRDRRSELDRLNRLGDVRLESCRQDANSIFGARVARQRDRGKKPSAFSLGLANMSDQREPVLIRQADIGDQGIGPLHFEHLERFSHRRHRLHAGARLSQHQRRQRPPVGIVVDDQDAQAVEPR